MQKTITTFLLTCLLINFGHAAVMQIKVIYGEDNRVDAENYMNKKFVELATATAARVANYDLVELNSEQYVLGEITLEERGICKSERFSQQPTTASCSGFLVAKNILVTAGHCMTSEFDCSEQSWVFDYKVDHNDQSEVVVDKSNVYKCKSIISQKLDNTTENDYAVIELESEVIDREPLKWRTEGVPSVGDQLVVIGHPSGLPTKIADGARVREVNDVFMVANLDTYGGNSGSAVFNLKTGLVEGILVRGENDYVFDSDQKCSVSNRVLDTEGRGEDVTLIASVDGLPEITVPEEPEPTEPEDPTPEPDEPTSNDDLNFIQRFFRWLGNLFRSIF